MRVTRGRERRRLAATTGRPRLRHRRESGKRSERHNGVGGPGTRAPARRLSLPDDGAEGREAGHRRQALRARALRVPGATTRGRSKESEARSTSVLPRDPSQGLKTLNKIVDTTMRIKFTDAIRLFEAAGDTYRTVAKCTSTTAPRRNSTPSRPPFCAHPPAHTSFAFRPQGAVRPSAMRSARTARCEGETMGGRDGQRRRRR